MPPESVNSTKRPFHPEPAFPWRCRKCGKQEVIEAETKYDAEIRHDGRLYQFTVANLRLPICQACGEKVFTSNTDCQINDAFREHLHILTPTQIRTRIEQLGLSQKEMSERMGIAEATLSRWVNGSQFPSRSMDNLLRVFLAFPQVRDSLCGEAQDSQLGLHDLGPGTSGSGKHVRHARRKGSAA